MIISSLAISLATYFVSTQPLTFKVNPNLLHFIARKEGFHVAGSLPARLHNPGALVYTGQPWAVPGRKGFAYFVDDMTGWHALDEDLAGKLRHKTPLGRAWEYLK